MQWLGTCNTVWGSQVIPTKYARTTRVVSCCLDPVDVGLGGKAQTSGLCRLSSPWYVVSLSMGCEVFMTVLSFCVRSSFDPDGMLVEYCS